MLLHVLTGNENLNINFDKLVPNSIDEIKAYSVEALILCGNEWDINAIYVPPELSNPKDVISGRYYVTECKDGKCIKFEEARKSKENLQTALQPLIKQSRLFIEKGDFKSANFFLAVINDIVNGTNEVFA